VDTKNEWRKVRAVSWQQSWMQWSENPASALAPVPFGPPHHYLKRSSVCCKHIILEHVLDHVLGQWQKEPSVKCLSVWQRRDLFQLQVEIHCPQYYFAIIRNPETAVEMDPYCASCFPKHKTRESRSFDVFTLVNAALCFQKRNSGEIQAGFANKHFPLARKPSNQLIQRYPGKEQQSETEDSPNAVLNPRSYFLTCSDKPPTSFVQRKFFTSSPLCTRLYTITCFLLYLLLSVRSRAGTLLQISTLCGHHSS